MSIMKPHDTSQNTSTKHYYYDRHRDHVSLAMLYGLKTCFMWMRCFWTAAIDYIIDKIGIDLNVAFRDQHYAFGVG